MTTKKHRSQSKTGLPALTHENFKNVPIRAVPDNTQLVRAFDHGWHEFQLADSKTPDEGKLATFRVTLVDGTTNRTLLILDHYGDEIITDAPTRQRLFSGSKYGDDTLGIFLDTGEVVHVGYILETHEDLGSFYSIVFFNFPYPIFLPKRWLAKEKIRLLESSKRPFAHTFNAQTLIDFIDHEASYGDLEANLVVSLHFQDTYVEIWALGDECCFREVTRWEHVQPPPNPKSSKRKR